MHDVDKFWELKALSDGQVLERLGTVLGRGRQLMAELIAHLGEVEERRLHLDLSFPSMFAYCLGLGMTEDEACRRIEVARMARRHPAIFPLLAAGKLSLSVVALLKHHLTEENHQDLIAAVCGKTVQQAREVIAARFPRPDVASSVRKLPARAGIMQPLPGVSEPGAESSRGMGEGSSRMPRSASAVTECSNAMANASADATAAEVVSATRSDLGALTSAAGGASPSLQAKLDGSKSGAHLLDRNAADGQRGVDGHHDGASLKNNSETGTSASCAPPGLSPPPASSPLPASASAQRTSRVEPLSAQRYKVQFTASAELKGKLELSRDLMRHAHPSGDFALIVERGLDLLIKNVMKRRFGARASTKAASATKACQDARRTDTTTQSAPVASASTPRPAPNDTAAPNPTMTRKVDGSPKSQPLGAGARVSTARPGRSALGDAPAPSGDSVTSDNVPRGSASASASAPIPRATRRGVLERDGLACSWVDERGVRCGARAWLEYDHRQPRAKGGDSGPENVRLLCRNHNRLAAEREYGRQHVERAVAEQQRARARGQHPVS